MKRFIAILAFAISLPLFATQEQQEARLLRFPAVGGGKIVFCYAGNLYSVDVNGGNASKLTSDVGYECFPKISPDGKTIAFTAQYDGNTEVYKMPLSGGVPERLTWSALSHRDMVGERMGPNNIVMCWTPDGKQIVYRSKQYCFDDMRATLCKVGADGGIPEIIPVTEGGFCSYSPDGKEFAMNRMFREFRTWKYYRGGQADEIWINRVGTTELRKITDNDAQDIFPMWVGDRIFYLSDRDRTMNLFVYDTKSGETRKLTGFTEYDCKFPAFSNDYIVFENGGYIYKYDIKADRTEKVTIFLEDDDVSGRSEFRSVGSSARAFSLSPDGNRALVEARGEIFSVPTGKGPVYNVSCSAGSHEREPVWSPDGRNVAWLSDKGGEYQVYLAPSSDMGSAKCLTSMKNGYPSHLQWSPDSRTLYFATEKRDIYSLDAATGKLERILVSDTSNIGDFNLSKDGNWAAYSKDLPNRMSAVYLYDVKSGKSYQVTDRWYSSSSPVFSQDGKYLFFTSDRSFKPQYSRVEWNASYQVKDFIFVLPLSRDVQSPTKLGSDEYKQPAKEEKAPAAQMKVDVEGMGQRIYMLPVEEGNHYLLFSDADKLYYASYDRPKSSIKVLDLKTLKESEAMTYQILDINSDCKKVLVRDKGDYFVVNPDGHPVVNEAKLPMQDVEMIVDHHAEWSQIFDESWRITRDAFYVENMHGADWDHIHDKYGQMLPYVRHRHDLTYLIGEMLGELNVGHAYITSGECPGISRIATGLLGARYAKDASTGAFRITKIFRGADWDDALISPLAQAGVDAKVGEYIIAVNGIPSANLKDVGQALVGKVGKTVALLIGATPSGKGARTVYVKPVESESGLAYFEWVQDNIAKVDELSGGRIGYIHIPDMGPDGLDMFTKLFYTQLDKKALIIDDRMNGGGNVSPMILERLQREVYRMSMHRNGINEPVPNEAFYGPKVCLIDKYSCSDGDLFPYGFRKLGLGKIIGKRSWGGIVGISGSRHFIDGQDMRTPFFTSYSSEGEWIIEGHGVEPDIDVDINPFDDYLGKDAQLEKAVEVLLEEMKDYPELPGTPAAPVKN